MSKSIKNLNFQALFEVSPEAMLLIDKAGLVVMSNPAALQLLGYTEDEIDGLKVESLMPERYREHHSQFRDACFHKIEQRDIGNSRALKALSRDGKELEVDIKLCPISAGVQHYVLVTLGTLDRRRQAEDELRVSEERLRLAKQAANLGIFDFDANHNILHWDERMRELWGAETNESVSNKRFITAIHPDDRAIRKTALDRAIDPTNNGEYNVEYRIINPTDGTYRWVSAVGRMHFEDGQATRLVGVARDITEQKSLEKKLQEQRAESEALFTQQVAAQTVSAIAHELNQPLAAISAYSEVALHALQSNNIHSLDNLKRALKGCVDQSQRAGKSLHELLAFLQKGDLVKTKLDINNIVRESLIIATSNGYGAINTKLFLNPDIPLVLGNRIQILKVLINLLRNAVEAMSIKKSYPSVTITVRTSAEGNMCHVLVQDSGPGIDTKAIKHLFEPFYTTKSTGIGMGLAISRALIEANGGQLWLEATSKTGATFHFTLPFAA